MKYLSRVIEAVVYIILAAVCFVAVLTILYAARLDLFEVLVYTELYYLFSALMGAVLVYMIYESIRGAAEAVYWIRILKDYERE